MGLPNIIVKANRKSTKSIVTDDLSIIKNSVPKPTSHNSLSIWTKKFKTKEQHNPKAQLYMWNSIFLMLKPQKDCQFEESDFIHPRISMFSLLKNL